MHNAHAYACAEVTSRLVENSKRCDIYQHCTHSKHPLRCILHWIRTGSSKNCWLQIRPPYLTPRQVFHVHEYTEVYAGFRGHYTAVHKIPHIHLDCGIHALMYWPAGASLDKWLYLLFSRAHLTWSTNYSCNVDCSLQDTYTNIPSGMIHCRTGPWTIFIRAYSWCARSHA